MALCWHLAIPIRGGASQAQKKWQFWSHGWLFRCAQPPCQDVRGVTAGIQSELVVTGPLSSQ